MKKEGLFEPTDFFYGREFVKIIAIYILAFYMLFNCEQTYVNLIITAIVHA